MGQDWNSSLGEESNAIGVKEQAKPQGQRCRWYTGHGRMRILGAASAPTEHDQEERQRRPQGAGLRGSGASQENPTGSSQAEMEADTHRWNFFVETSILLLKKKNSQLIGSGSQII